MAEQLFDNGETFTINNDLSGITFEVGLYLDSTDYDNDGTVEGDKLSDSATYSSITTEPAGTAYAAQTQSTVTVDLDANNDGQITLNAVTFDVSDSSANVDAVYVRDSATGTLLFANNIGHQDLSTKDGNLEISNIGFSLD